MSKVNELRSERAKVNDAVQALAAIESAGGQLSVEQLAEFGALQAKFGEITAQLDRAIAAERLAAASAVPVDAPTNPAAPAQGPPAYAAVPKAKELPGAKVAQMVRALAAAQGDGRRAAQIAIDRGFGDEVAMSLNTLSPGAGGILVPQNLSSEIIELLRPKAVVRRLGTRTMPLNNGNVTIPRLKGGAIVGYIGSDADVPVSQQSFGDLKLSAKKLAALVPISNDLLAYSGSNQNVDQVVVGDLTSALATREDKAFIRDDGSADAPKGLRFWAMATNLIPVSDGATVQKVDTDLSKAILALETVDANLTTPGWIMAPRVFRFLESLRDGNGNRVYPEMAQKQLKGYPVGVTTQVPTNLGAGANESEVYFVDFGDCFIGEDETLMIDYSKEASYDDGSGKTVSAFQRDQTLVRVIAKHDFGPRHVESISVLTKVTWGS
ncbi:phage major capsid protein [Collimonas humicola]|uniref:phage major capsid protein n=1 Tax=Collimonas humicola TaxID=2825886 RepID=UPI001B8B1BDC|nr:phage major capsid protein [Collimonas humicola]